MVEVNVVHAEMIKQVLENYLPPGSIVWVFGSRARGNPKKYSDLDLAINMGQPMPIRIMSSLAHAFDESDLPYKVDIVDWMSIDQNFQNHIESEFVEFWRKRS